MIDFTHMAATIGDSADPVTPSPRLEKASHQFEASMLQELLKPMQQQSALFKDDGEDDDSSDSDSSLREYGAEVMARALSEQGGLGISKMVLTKLAPIEAAQEKQKPTAFRKY